ncbi:MAG: substrate-binding domain-containing protein [Erysipelotrichaceae bacterium]|nr:substrate-binding domain-containing protein [Erysipelotrichaceae bacterium]
MKKLIALMLAVVMVGCGNASSGVTGKVNVYTRDASSGTREAFEKIVEIEGQLTSSAIEVTSNGDMATKVGMDKNGIGYVSLSTDFQGSGIVPLQFEGVEATEENVLNGSYQMQRPFVFATRASQDFTSEAEEKLVAAFVDFLYESKEGRQIVKKAGGIVDVEGGTPWAELAKKHEIVNQDNSSITITTAGSTSVEKTVKAALEAFQPMAGNFQFTMNHTGSSDGWKRVLGSEKDGANKASIGFASRSFKTNEEPVDNALATGTYCVDAVVSVVNKEQTAFSSLTKQQLQEIFNGSKTQWEDVK